jgi:hypothetical protein
MPTYQERADYADSIYNCTDTSENSGKEKRMQIERRLRNKTRVTRSEVATSILKMPMGEGKKTSDRSYRQNQRIKMINIQIMPDGSHVEITGKRRSVSSEASPEYDDPEAVADYHSIIREQERRAKS